MTSDVIKQIKAAEAKADSIKAEAKSNAKKTAVKAQADALSESDKTDASADTSVKNILAQAEREAADIVRKELFEAEKECRALQQEARLNINDAVKDCVERIVGICQ